MTDLERRAFESYARRCKAMGSPLIDDPTLDDCWRGIIRQVNAEAKEKTE